MSWRVHNLVKSKIVGKTINPEGRKSSAFARKIVLLAYADVCAHDGTGVFVAKKTVAAEHEINRETVVDATQSLLDDGLLVIDASKWPEGKRPGAEGFTFVYRIVISRVFALPDAIPPKCRNSDTLDDASVDGDELAKQYLAALARPVKKSRKVSVGPTLKVSESGGQSVGGADTNLTSRTIDKHAHESAHRRADPDYAREAGERDPGAGSVTEAEIARVQTLIATLRWDLVVAERGDKVIGGEFHRAAPAVARVKIPERIAELEKQIATMRAVG